MAKSYNPSNYIKQLAETFLFSQIPSDEIKRLLHTDGITVAHYKQGEDIVTPDHFSRCLGIILQGSAAVTKGEGTGAASVLMSVLRSPDMFGAASLFCDHTSYVSKITAQESTWVMLLSEDSVRTVLRENTDIMENYMRYLTQRIRFLSERIDAFVSPSTEERLYLFLTNNADNGVFREGYTMKKLSEALCISRATLYRAIKALEDAGRIARDGKNIALYKEEK